MPELELQDLVDLVARRVAERLGHGEQVDGWAHRPLVAGNWKMNAPAGPSLTVAIQAHVARLAAELAGEADLVLLVPQVLLAPVLAEVARAGLAAAVGCQDVHEELSGAHTGETSAAQVAALGGRWTLVGHSERRAAGETDARIRAKLRTALRAGLSAILCVGEREDERRSGATWRVLKAQLQIALSGLALDGPEPARLALAYEPVWAIGSGRTPEPEEVQEACSFVRTVAAGEFGHAWASRMRVLYGGSVVPENAREILSCRDVDGVLVGGASLDADRFAAILRIARQAARRAAGG